MIKVIDYFFVTLLFVSFLGIYLFGLLITISAFRIKIEDVLNNKGIHGRFLKDDFNPYNFSKSWRLFQKLLKQNPKKN